MIIFDKTEPYLNSDQIPTLSCDQLPSFPPLPPPTPQLWNILLIFGAYGWHKEYLSWHYIQKRTISVEKQLLKAWKFYVQIYDYSHYRMHYFDIDGEKKLEVTSLIEERNTA